MYGLKLFLAITNKLTIIFQQHHQKYIHNPSSQVILIADL